MRTIQNFNLIFEDGTSETTRAYSYYEVYSLYTNELVRTNSGLKRCVKVEAPNTKVEEQLRHRLAIIQDNLSQLIDFIDEERMMERFDKPTNVSNSAWNLIHNMERACCLMTNKK